jgi:hypothetical protein
VTEGQDGTRAFDSRRPDGSRTPDGNGTADRNSMPDENGTAEGGATAKGTGWTERALPVLVGFVAVVAALLATLQMEAAKLEERSLLLSSRLSVLLVERINAGYAIPGFQLDATRQTLLMGFAATARRVEAFGLEPDAAAFANAVAGAEEQALTALGPVIASLSEEPRETSGLDPRTRAAIAAVGNDLGALVADQNRQVDLADRYGEQGARTILGLWLLALAGVLAGLAGVFKGSPAGRVSFVAGTVALIAAAAWGGSAVLV